jgi:group I intron endonuclease
MTFKQRRLMKAVRFKRGKVGGIYCWKNMVNGKELIGQTKHFPTRRSDYKGSKMAGNSDFRKDVKKYGWNNFKVFCLNTATNPDIRNRLETFYILRRNTLTPNGYNQYKGGDCYEFTDGWKEKVKIGKKTSKKYQSYLNNQKVMVKCLYCEKEFHPIGNHKRKRKFCSIDCLTKWNQTDDGISFYKMVGSLGGKLGGRPKKEREKRVCFICGKEFLARPKEYKKYCSKECSLKARNR